MGSKRSFGERLLFGVAVGAVVTFIGISLASFTVWAVSEIIEVLRTCSVF